MRFFQYALLACFIFCIIAEEDEAEENEGNEGGSSIAKPQHEPDPAANLAEKPVESAKPQGTNAGENHPEQTAANATDGVKQQHNKGWRSGRSRCSIRPQQTNCAGSRLLLRWWFNPETHMCESFQFPVCNAKAAAFFTCKMCMQRCLRIWKVEEEEDNMYLWRSFVRVNIPPA
nr:anticoagulant protein rhipilin-1-like [Dermacentor andersoni]